VTARGRCVLVTLSWCAVALLGAADAGAATPAARAETACARTTTFAGNVAHVPSRAGSVWALAQGRGQLPPNVGDDLKIVWRVTGTGPLRVAFIGPDGTPRPLTFGPERHLASSFHRPGEEWGTGFHFDRAGCWQIRVDRGRVHTTARLLVAQSD
jgi:hypothetical protein